MLKILPSITKFIENYDSEDAVIYCDGNEEVKKLKYEDVKIISKLFYENLKYLRQTSICYGLLMNNNIYIPSLIISLQQLRCCFLFLDTKQAISNLLTKLRVRYIIAYNVECCIPNTEILFSIVINVNNVYDIYVIRNSDICIYENINYIIQTSGTTDAQKVVKVEYQSIASNIHCLKNRLHITKDDVIYYGTPLTFDPSMVELYLALTTGAKLLIVSESIKSNPYQLYTTLFQNKFNINITFLQMCPTIFLQWNIPEITFILQKSSLRILLLGGEDFPNVLRTLKKSEKLEIYNIYGITELSCWAFLWQVNTDEQINLGSVLDDTVFEIKGTDGRNILTGEGELFIGSYNRICYLENEAPHTISKPLMRKTGDRVMINGNKIVYKGRCDDVIKRFGHRVNLLDIENCIYKHTTLKSICIWIEDKRKLVLFVLVDEGKEAVVTRIKDKLRIKLLHVLPKQCNPDYIELLPRLPLTQHCKVDKMSLLSRANEVVEMASSTDKCIIHLFTTLWSKYFMNIGSDVMHKKSFHELGGTSLMRIQFSQELAHNYYRLLPSSVYDYVFTNTYDDVLIFLKKLQIGDKRKLSICHGNTQNTSNKISNVALEIKWRYDLHACVDSTPVLLRKKRLVAIGSFANIFAILNLDTGDEILKVTLPNAIEGSCLVSPCENYIYIGCYDHNMYCIETNTGEIAWCYETEDCIKNKANFNSENTIIFGSYDKYLYCINAKIGDLVWKIYIGEAITADSLVKRDIAIVVTIKGSCLCLNRCGIVIWHLKFDSPIFGSPVELRNEFVLPDVLGNIHCLNFEGVELWTLKVDGNIYSSIFFFNDCLIFGNHHGVVYCFDLPVGCLKPQLRHELVIDSATSSTAAGLTTEDGEAYVVIACISGYIYLINIRNFCITSSLKLDDNVFSSPIVEQNNIFLGSRDNNLICINVR